MLSIYSDKGLRGATVVACSNLAGDLSANFQSPHPHRILWRSQCWPLVGNNDHPEAFYIEFSSEVSRYVKFVSSKLFFTVVSSSSARLDTRKSAHSNSQSPASSVHRSINIVLPSMLPPRRSVMDVFKKPHEVEVRFDLVSNLPRELAVLLFRCLPLPDLCR